MQPEQRSLIDDLYNVPENGKAEIVNGKVVRMSATGSLPGLAVGSIHFALKLYEKEHKTGHSFTDNIGFIVSLPNRQSFSPDAAWYVGNVNTMKFLDGAPTFAVEVRSEGDYGPKAERHIKQKIKDYFAAGTLVVWDVDLQSPSVITMHRADAPDTPRIFHRDEIANAEPALLGWRFHINDLFL